MSAVNKHFGEGEARVHVLKSADFTARFGELMMLVGPSGCGKTTLLSVLAGTLSADDGEVSVFNERIDRMSNAQLTRFRARNIGFIDRKSVV